MSGKQTKLLRNQLRGIVQELLPSLMTEEQFKNLNDIINARLLKLEGDVKKTLHEMNERQKDTMGYLVRQAASSPLETKKE